MRTSKTRIVATNTTYSSKARYMKLLIEFFMTMLCVSVLPSLSYGQNNIKISTISISDNDFTLVNSNPVPAIIGEIPDQEPVFPASYDWNQQSIIVNRINSLNNNLGNPEVIKYLLNNCNNDKYCLTLDADQSVQTYEVGDICLNLLLDNLTAPYEMRIPEDFRAYKKLISVDYIPNDKVFEWFSEKFKSNKHFYELQIEACEWAIIRIQKLDHLEEAEVSKFVKFVEEQIGVLKQNKKPICLSKFIPTNYRGLYKKPQD